MKTYIRFSNRRFRFLTTAFAFALAFLSSMAFAESAGEKVADSVWNLHDQGTGRVQQIRSGLHRCREARRAASRQQPTALHTQRSTADPAEESRSPEPGHDQAPATATTGEPGRGDLKQNPRDHPRRAELEAELKKVASQMPATQQNVQDFTKQLEESNAAINRWKQGHDPTFVPPPKKTTDVPPPQSEPVEPPKTDDGGGSTDNGLDALKKKEAEQEAQARALGKEREAAVNKYLDDPSADNRAEAEAIKQKLDGMVEDLNRYRGQVDGLEGTSRPPIHVKSAKTIAKHHKKRKKGGATNTDGTPTTSNSGGMGCGSSGTGGEQHNPDGSDVAGSGYQDVAPDGGGGGGSKGGGGRSQRSNRKTHSKMASSENHHHAAGTKGKKQSKTTSSGQYQRNAGGTNGRNKQSMQQKKYSQQQQHQQQQQRKRKNKNR